MFAELKRYDDAFAAYDKALALKADLAEHGVVAATHLQNSSATMTPLPLMTEH